MFARLERSPCQRFGLIRSFQCVIVLASLVCGQDNATAKHVVVRAARMLDVKAGKIVSNAVVVIEGERISAVGTGSIVPQGAEVIDLGDATLMPGLIDCHTHLMDRTEHSGEPNSYAINLLTKSQAYRAGNAQGRVHLCPGR
jgi:imidazolonepropionase-like amidohydrolase